MDTKSSKSSGHSPSIGSSSSMVSTLKPLPEEANKVKDITDLPIEMQKEVWGYLGLKDKSALASSSKEYKTLLSTELMTAKLTAKLLMLVAHGAQTQAQAMLVQYPDLSLQRSDVTDYSGRKFKNITAYEYAYWAKDTHMCRMLERHMDENTKAAMLKKVTVIDTVGLTYEQGGHDVAHSKHFDMTPLTTALQNYVNGYDAWDAANNYDAMMAAWMRVGLAQRDLPVHVVNEYCRPDRSFYPLPAFNEDNLPRILTYRNFNTNLDGSLFPLVVSGSSGLGVDFALIRARAELGVALCRRAGAVGWRWFASIDLAAVSHLDEIRTADLTQSRTNLGLIEPELDLRSRPSR